MNPRKPLISRKIFPDRLSASGGVSWALAQAAGRGVQREREKLVASDRSTLGDVVRTGAGALSCRHLYHAITIDFCQRSRVDEAVLRRLVRNLLDRATADGVRSLGMPALGTGFANFDLAVAAEIVIGELLDRLPEMPVQHVILALMGDEAQRLFYERLVRSNEGRFAVRALRRHESGATKTSLERSLEPLGGLASIGAGPMSLGWLASAVAKCVIEKAGGEGRRRQRSNAPADCRRDSGTVPEPD